MVATYPPIQIDCAVGKVETAGMGKPERQRFQFSLRKLLLWTVVVALTLSILSPLELGGLFPFGWFVTVLMLRWGLGSRVAAWVSIMAGMLLFAWASCLVSASVSPSRYGYGEAALVGGSMGVMVGLVLFLLVDGTCRVVDWIDRIGQSDG